MNATQATTYQLLRGASAFFDANPEATAEVTATGAHQRLLDVVAAFSTHVDDQSGSHLKAQGLTERQYVLRVDLRQQMKTIARVARADLPNTPEFSALRMPRGRQSPERLRSAAGGMAQVAAEHVPVFTAAGLPADFVAQLTAAAQAILVAVDDRKITNGRRSGATAGVAHQVKEGKRVLRILDALMERALHNNPTLLANWKSVIRVPRSTVAAHPVVEPLPSTTPVAA